MPVAKKLVLKLILVGLLISQIFVFVPTVFAVDINTSDKFYWNSAQGYTGDNPSVITGDTKFKKSPDGSKNSFIAENNNISCKWNTGTDINGAALYEFMGDNDIGNGRNINVSPFIIDSTYANINTGLYKDPKLYKITKEGDVGGNTGKCIVNDLGNITIDVKSSDAANLKYDDPKKPYTITGQNYLNGQTFTILGDKKDTANAKDYAQISALPENDESNKDVIYYRTPAADGTDCANYLKVNVKNPSIGKLYLLRQGSSSCELTGSITTGSASCTSTGGTAGSICNDTTQTQIGSISDQPIANFEGFDIKAAKNPPKEATIIKAKPNPEDVKESGCSQALTPFGWILCPIATFADGIVNWFQDVVESILYINPSILVNGGPLQQVWRIFSNLASALIVLIALAMIAGQIFNFEIFSAYTVKKVLPRLVIGAILIQLSWFLCATLIQFTNAVGSGIYWLLLSPFQQYGGDSNFITFEQVINLGAGNTNTNGTDILANAVGLAGVGAAAAVGIASGAWIMLIVAALGVIISLVVALITLMIRAMFIVILIVLAPVAIAAWILPGTQRFWDMWWKMFSRLLMMFPLIMLLFAGGVMAATILKTAGSATDVTGAEVLLNFAVLVAYFAPIFMIAMTYKFAGGAFASIGTLGNKLGKQAQGGIGKRFNPLSERFKANKDAKKEYRKGEAYKTLADRDAGMFKKAGARWRTGNVGIGIRKSTRDAYARRTEQAISAGEAAEAKYKDEQAAKEMYGWQVAGNASDRGHLVNMAQTGNIYQQRAAIKRLTEMGDVDGMRAVAAHMNTLSRTTDSRSQYETMSQTGEFAGKFIDKAPDLVKTAGPAFASVNGEQVSKMHHTTATQMVNHLMQERQQALASGNQQQIAAADRSMAQLGQALHSVVDDPQLRRNISPETLAAIKTSFSSAGFATGISTLGTNGQDALRRISSNGIIR
jgi:hypothetical protein